MVSLGIGLDFTISNSLSLQNDFSSIENKPPLKHLDASPITACNRL